jgi:hypothetical protein
MRGARIGDGSSHCPTEPEPAALCVVDVRPVQTKEIVYQAVPMLAWPRSWASFQATNEVLSKRGRTTLGSIHRPYQAEYLLLGLAEGPTLR